MTNEPPDGATPIDPDEAEGLLQEHVATRGELDELEEANIQLGLRWAHERSLQPSEPQDVLDEDFLYELHRRMFDAVWAWAGQVRATNKNIGVEKHAVRTEVRKLIDDARYWREAGIHDADELAVRFHHRLAAIHPVSQRERPPRPPHGRPDCSTAGSATVLVGRSQADGYV